MGALKLVIKKCFGVHPRDVMLLGRRLAIIPSREFYIFRIAKSLSLAPSHRELGLIMTTLAIMQKGDLFVDVGANIGLFSVFVASYAEALDIAILAIEPNPDTYERLKANIGAGPNVKGIQGACSNLNGQGHLLLTEDSLTSMLDGAGARERASQWGYRGDSVPVPLFCLDALLNGNSRRIVLKIDVEGHELEVLEGARNTLKSGSVRAVIIDGGGEDIVDYMATYRYAPFDAVSMAMGGRSFEKLFLPLDD